MITDSTGTVEAVGHLEGKAAWHLIRELMQPGWIAYIGEERPWKIRTRQRGKYQELEALQGPLSVVKQALAEGSSSWLGLG